MSDDDLPLVRLKRVKRTEKTSKLKKRKALSSVVASRPKVLSRRDEFLQCPLLDLQSKEEGYSEDCSGSYHIISWLQTLTHKQATVKMMRISLTCHTCPKVCVLQLNFWYWSVTGSQHPNGSPNLYLASLGSQAEKFGFSKPLHQTRRGLFECVATPHSFIHLT